MKDFVKEYKKKNIINILSIGALSLFLAFSLYFSTQNTNVYKGLQGNVLGTKTGEERGDIFIQKNEDNSLSVITNNSLENLKSLSLSLFYNPEDIKIKNFDSLIENGEIQTISNEEGSYTILFLLDEVKTINAGQAIIDINTEKLKEVVAFLNINTVNYTNQEGITTELSSSGIDF